MYKKILALLCLTLSIVLFCMAVSATEAETTDIDAIYVSKNAAEGGTGTVDAPVATLSDAYTFVGNNGTIYLMDTVTASATEGDCFIAPTHTGKITITSASGYNGALDLTGIKHFHFGGDTEWNNIVIVANEAVLTADNHTVTMGEGLAMSSPSADIYRGGHTYSGAKIYLAAYAPCEVANIACASAGGKLNVYSGEYWSISAWYGASVSVSGGETQILLDTCNSADHLWIRYLCPGLFASAPDGVLTSKDSKVTVIVNDGVNTLEVYRFTKNAFLGEMTVDWLLKKNLQGESMALVSQDFLASDGAKCILNVYSDMNNVVTADGAYLLMRGAMSTYLGVNKDNDLSNYCKSDGHIIEEQPDGRLLCKYCMYEQCRHLTTRTNILEDTAICTMGNYVEEICTDICGEKLGEYYDNNFDPDNHGDHLGKYFIRDDYKYSDYICVGCGNVVRSFPMEESSNLILLTYETDFDEVMHEAASRTVLYEDVEVFLNDDVVLSVPAEYQTPIFDGTITISGGTIHFPDAPRRIYMNGNMVFEYLTFKTGGTYNGAHIYAQNNKLVMGEGIVMGNDGSIQTGEGYPNCNSVRMYIVGGFEGPTDNVMNTDITIRSGDYWFVGGFNRNASTNNGTSKITVGKTNDEDYLSINYLTPFSTGDGYITEESEGNIIVDGKVNVRWFYVTTMNKATTDTMYTTNVVLNGDINPADEGGYLLDVRGCPKPHPLSTVNLYYNALNESAYDDYSKFKADGSLTTINATVTSSTYDNYCVTKLGGHFDSDSNAICDECGSQISN